MAVVCNGVVITMMLISLFVMSFRKNMKAKKEDTETEKEQKQRIGESEEKNVEHKANARQRRTTEQNEKSPLM